MDPVITFGFVYFIALFGTIWQAERSLHGRLNRLEQKMNVLLEQAGLDPAAVGPKVSDTVRQLAQTGKKIEAIKLLRTEAKLGLKEAKDIIDQL